MALEFGSGTQADPYLLVNLADVTAMFNSYLATNTHFALVADLDLSYTVITCPFVSCNFKLYGRGHKLLIRVQASAASYLFNAVQDASLIDVWLNLKIVNNYFTATASSRFLMSNSVLEFDKPSYRQSTVIGGGTNGLLISSSSNDIGHGTSVNMYKHGVAVANTINTASFADGNPFNPANYPTFSDTKWIFDGVNLPRPRPQATADLTNRYGVKGQTKVGGSNRQRNLAVFTENGLRYKVQDTKADGSFFLNLKDVTTPVIVLAYDDIGAKAAINTVYSLNQIIHPATPNGFRYRCTLAGNSGATIPPEPWSTTTVLTIGAAKFTPEPVYEPKAHGPLLPVLFNVITEQPV